LAFARYKGEAEKALLAAGFPSLYLFRPAYIYPVDLPRVSGAVPEPGDSGRRLGLFHGGCRRKRNGAARRPGFREP